MNKNILKTKFSNIRGSIFVTCLPMFTFKKKNSPDVLSNSNLFFFFFFFFYVEISIRWKSHLNLREKRIFQTKWNRHFKVRFVKTRDKYPKYTYIIWLKNNKFKNLNPKTKISWSIICWRQIDVLLQNNWPIIVCTINVIYP